MIREHVFVAGFAFAIILADTGTALADTRENPYQEIARRNPFALRPVLVERPAPPVNPPVLSPTEVRLTGITDLVGRLLVTLQYEDRQTRKVRYSPLLAEGQGDGTAMILDIDPVKALVRIKQGQTEMTLDFVRNGVQPSAIAAIPVAPVLPPGPSKPPLSREQVEAIERRRRELQEAFGQSVPGRGGAAVMPPTLQGGR